MRWGGDGDKLARAWRFKGGQKWVNIVSDCKNLVLILAEYSLKSSGCMLHLWNFLCHNVRSFVMGQVMQALRELGVLI